MAANLSTALRAVDAVPKVATIPADVVTLIDHENHARKVLDDNAQAYFCGAVAYHFQRKARGACVALAALAARRS